MWSGKYRPHNWKDVRIMKFMIKHEAKGRMRIHAVQNRMSYAQADTLLYFLHSQKEVTFAKVYDLSLIHI